MQEDATCVKRIGHNVYKLISNNIEYTGLSGKEKVCHACYKQARRNTTNPHPCESCGSKPKWGGGGGGHFRHCSAYSFLRLVGYAYLLHASAFEHMSPVSLFFNSLGDTQPLGNP